MKLTKSTDTKYLPEMHFVYVDSDIVDKENKKDWEISHLTWEHFFNNSYLLKNSCNILYHLTFFKNNPQLYLLAGAQVDREPSNLPEGFKYKKIPESRYTRFILKGPYSDLDQAWNEIFSLMKKNSVEVADDFYVELYLNSPQTTPEDFLITDLLVPIKQEN